ncbi:MAG: RusA family crossover junction endodeoxyribonuclease [Chloroflexi bacterium]|nr:RusA family crossover junction endodeoxyribonuclease [Chloroflexota bacterium]
MTFVVDFAPPWKQTPSDLAEKTRQKDRKEFLQMKAKEAFTTSVPLITKCAVSIRYARSRGRADSANIIGGVLNSLQRIIFKDDNQVIEINYTQWVGSGDWYQITVTELVRSSLESFLAT